MINTYLEADFVKAFERVSEHVNKTAMDHGFWDTPKGTNRNEAEMIALMHSELSEALEALRKNPNIPDGMVPEFKSTEVELADCIIRIMDMAYGLNLRVAEALIAKAKFNETRPHKHGKQF